MNRLTSGARSGLAAWLPDGQRFVTTVRDSLGGERVIVRRLDGSGAARALPAEGDGYELAGRYSPDGRWLAYVSNKTGREEVCVRRFGGSGGSWQVSTQGGGGPRWGRDGRELFFVSGEILCRVAVSTSGDQLSLGQPEPMFEASPSLFELAFREHDYDAVGDRFLFTRPPRGLAERREIAVSLGWAARLEEKVRGGRAR